MQRLAGYRARRWLDPRGDGLGAASLRERAVYLNQISVTSANSGISTAPDQAM